MLKKTGLLLFATLLLLLCGCPGQSLAPETPAEPPDTGTTNASITLVVTRDFGSDILLEERVTLAPDTTAMEALQAVATVETKYGGGFVNAINGLSSTYEGEDNSQKDWLFYINGMSSSTGAKEYILRDGDIEHWDFREWSYHHYVPAIVGAFPEPFRNGQGGKWKPTVITYEEQFADQAHGIAGMLQEEGIAEVSAVSFNQLSAASREQCHLILVGGADNEFIAELNAAHRKLGFYAHFQENKLVVLDAAGAVAGEYGPGSGIIQATQNPWHPKGTGAGESAVLMVSGTDSAGVNNAAEKLLTGTADLRHAYAAVITTGKTIRIPQ